MSGLDCSSEVMNELMEFTVDSIAEEGLTQLIWTQFHAKVEINVEILEKLASKTSNLQVLTIRDMNRTSE